MLNVSKVIFQPALCFFGALLLVAPLSHADTIGFNFTSQWASPRLEGKTAHGFSQWTDSVSSSAPAATEVPSSTSPYAVTTPINAPMVTIAWSSSNMYAGGAEDNAEQALYRVYLDDGGSGVSVTVSGLSSWLTSTGDYRVTLFRATDTSNAGFRAADIKDGLTSTLLETLPSIPIGSAVGGGNFPTGTGGGGTRDYQVSASTFASDSLEISIAPRDGTNRGTIAGFMIEGVTLVPEPASAVLGLMGFLLLAQFIRRH